MKEFIKKNKKILILLLIFLALILVGVLVYFFFLKDENTEESIDTTDSNQEQSETQEPQFTLTSSKDAFLDTYESAKTWSSDALLFDCSGLPISSMEYPDVTYYFLGAEDGEYSKWFCTYYSKNLKQTRIYIYEEGEVDDGTDGMDIGEYGYLTYDSPKYIRDLSTVIDSKEVYSLAVENGMDDTVNYVNMYFFNSSAYGYVWKVEERDMEEKDEYGIGVLKNTYVFDKGGELIQISQESVY